MIINFANCIFKNNKGNKSKSIIRIRKTTASFINTIFNDNTALYGAALYTSWSQLQFKNCTFKDNYALKSGGAIYLRESVSNFSHCTFLSNKVGATNTITLRKIQGFLTGVGGAVVSDHCKLTSLNYCHFQQNEVTISGGAIFQRGTSSRLKLDNTRIDSVVDSKEIVACRQNYCIVFPNQDVQCHDKYNKTKLLWHNAYDLPVYDTKKCILWHTM